MVVTAFLVGRADLGHNYLNASSRLIIFVLLTLTLLLNVDILHLHSWSWVVQWPFIFLCKRDIKTVLIIIIISRHKCWTAVDVAPGKNKWTWSKNCSLRNATLGTLLKNNCCKQYISFRSFCYSFQIWPSAYVPEPSIYNALWCFSSF